MNSELRTAAVLLPVFRDAEGELRVVLVVRADDGGQHGGQLGLPGGQPEPDDADLLATALREAEEEVAELLQVGHGLHLHPHDFLIGLDRLITDLQERFKSDFGALAGEYDLVDLLGLSVHEAIGGFFGVGTILFDGADGVFIRLTMNNVG